MAEATSWRSVVNAVTNRKPRSGSTVQTATRSRAATFSFTKRRAASCARDIERGEVKPRSKRRTKERRAAGFIGAIAVAGAFDASEAKSIASNDVMGCFFFSSYSAKFADVSPRTGLPELSSTVTGISTTWTLIVDALCEYAEIAMNDATMVARSLMFV